MPDAADLDKRVDAALDRVRPQLVEDRRHLHKHPELSYMERATAEMCAERCETLGFTVRTEVGGNGVIADLDSGRPGPTVMLRADTDALPLTERGGDGRPVVSANSGAMHACGHDGHVAMALGAAAILKDVGDAWSGTVRMCFQPAEEVAGGAQPMIDAGAADGVDRVLGIHLWAPLQVGRVAVGPGPLFGSADAFGLVVRGQGGHGGMPHMSIDPVVCAAQVVTTLQTIVSRETSPFNPAVVTVGQIQGGAAFNVIAEEVRMLGTVRAFEEEERERLMRRIAEVAADVARSMRCEAEFIRAAGCPPVVSDAEVAETVRRAAVATIGEENVDTAPRITVGDDVALFLQRAPGCYFLVGAGDVANRAVAPHHHPEFDIDERCLPVGAAVLARAALSELNA
jgi:amidohydrolase